MPQNKYAIARYRLIDKILRTTGYAKTSDLAKTCMKKLGYSISQRTIQMDLHAMRYDPFVGIFAPIEYCKKRKCYYYTHTNFSLTFLNFTENELKVLIYLSKYLNGKIDNNYYIIFQNCIKKIKEQQ